MREARHRLAPAVPGMRATALLGICALVLGACGKGSHAAGGPTAKLAPVAEQGAITLSTRNTTRLGGADAATDAAAVARVVYPGLTASTRPPAVLLVGEGDWPAALAGSVMAAAPNGWPMLFADAKTLPDVTLETLRALQPTGATALGGAQVIRIGTTAELPKGYVARTLSPGGPAETTAAVQRLERSVSSGSEPRQAIVLAADTPHPLAAPAAGLAAESGAPILFVTNSGVPPATAAALRSLHRPSIYVLDASALSTKTRAALRRFGTVTTLTKGDAPRERFTANSISVARFTDGTFGWGVKDPGHGLVVANADRPLDGPAAALLSATAQYGPLLMLERPRGIPAALSSYLGDIQPAYASAPEFQPVRGVYNHGWLIGDETAVSAVTQAELDSLLEITEREKPATETSTGQPESPSAPEETPSKPSEEAQSGNEETKSTKTQTTPTQTQTTQSKQPEEQSSKTSK
ncbi:MAG TPA: cell wall-binding repeat-containing protein [Solirubrobacteraceae bacterium]|nr:cell wall-binding repeat-containing protein [Solirubrobacteraceae bacterium]